MIELHTDFPGANIHLDQINGQHIKVRPDLRDSTGEWFYWAFRLTGAAGQTIHIDLQQRPTLTSKGPAISLDEGWTWSYFGDEFGKEDHQFTIEIPEAAASVLLSMGMPYTLKHLDAFRKKWMQELIWKQEVLCKTRAGREVPLWRIGVLEEPSQVIVMSARHHACEMMANYVIEGFIEEMLSDSAAGAWLREQVQVVVLPLLDLDGVEEGDQGKLRSPHDHNRDYGESPIYPECQALMEELRRWAGGPLKVMFDVHCPYIRYGDYNDHLYMVGLSDPEIEAQQIRFAQILEQQHQGSLHFLADDFLPFGESWNTNDNYEAGMPASRWAAGLEGIQLSTTFEVPYAEVKGETVTVPKLIEFGKSLAQATQLYLRQNTEFH